MMTSPADITNASMHPVHQAARLALEAGLCPVPASTDGLKRPRDAWKQYQASRPTLEQVDAWFGNGHAGWGVIAGTVSGNLEMFELEGRAMADGMWDEFYDRCEAAGLLEVINRIAYDGYTEETPSGGIHILFHVDGTPLGNTKLAQRLNGTDVQVLMETRGQGGFVVLAPSNGATHPSGKPWIRLTGSLATIATITEAERDAIYAVARSFDEMPERVIALSPPIDLKPYKLGHAESWVDELCRQLAQQPWSDILGRYGLQHHHDSGDVSYWTRPGKDTKDGYSATTNAKGTDRLIVFTSAMLLEQWSGNGPAPSYDRLDVIAAYEYCGDRMAAARALREPPLVHSQMRPRHVDANGEIDGFGHLPDDFWQARPSLAHIRQAAHCKVRSADAYLGTVLARVAALTHPSIQLPGIVGTEAPLTFYLAQVGRSGGGKSSTVKGASRLLPYDGLEVADQMPLGSGEGLIELFFEWVDEVGSDGKTRKVKKQTRHGAFIYLDEGQALNELGSRKGSVLMPVLRTAWSGAVLGTSNASAETKRRLGEGAYAIGLVIAFQPSKAAELLADAAGGTPQRFDFVQDIDPFIPEERPEWPGPLPWRHPTLHGYLGDTQTLIMGFPATIADKIQRQALLVGQGKAQRDELDSHATLRQMKVAGLLAVLEERTDITEEDWQLAEAFQKVSHGVRATILAAVAIEQRKARDASIAAHVNREGAVVDDQVDRAIHRMAKAIGRHVHRKGCDGGCKLRCVTHACTGGDKHLAPVGDAIEHAAELKWIAIDGDLIKPGEARPT